MTLAFRNQNTLGKPVSVTGFGYWSSLDVTVEFRPAPADSGVVFVRRDVPAMTRIPAAIGFRANAPRRTTLFHQGNTVDMVEHIMAALAGMQIDNCEVWVDRAEMPGCDGSSLDFVNAIQLAGIQPQQAFRSKLVIEKSFETGNDESWIRAEPNPAGQFEIQFSLNYLMHPVIGQQSFRTRVDPVSFAEQIASARTFLLKHEAEYLNRQGLGRRATFQDLVVFDDNGPIDNPLRFENECVRHKTLDVIGDFALAPFDIVGTFTACRSGHRLNAEMVQQMLQYASIVRPDEHYGARKSA